MSYKNVSSGTGKESSLPSNKGDKGGKEEFPEAKKSSSSPWDSLRPVEPKEDEPKPPSRLGRFFRKALRWVTGIVFVFGLGVVTTWFVRVQPRGDQINDLKSQLQASEITVTELESEYSILQGEKQDLEAQLSDEQSQVENLNAELLDSQIHIEVMKIWIDVTSAQLALENQDTVTAKASLTGTDARLMDLQEKLNGEDKQTIQAMRDRLVLSLDELEKNRFAALRDLEVLASNLQALERSLFGD
jgi:hypothetical protein